MKAEKFVPYSVFSQRKAWDERYRIKGRQWGNAPSKSPPTPESGIILELGVGDGKNLRALQCPGSLLIGIDFSLSALCLCRADPILEKTSLLLADACLLPVRGSVVNQIFAHHILGHLQNQFCQFMMDELYRVLMPGGTSYVTVFATGDLRDGKGLEVDPGTFLRGDGIVTRYFNQEDLEMLCRKFLILTIKREEWLMRIKGTEYIRAELVAVLKKPE